MCLIHFFTPKELRGIQLPSKFNSPFNYEPHILCRRAAKAVMDNIAAHPSWEKEFQQGKMLGVLIIREQIKNGIGRIGYIVSYSGQIQSSLANDYFVPPVYDLSVAHDFYLQEDKLISDLNRQIFLLQHDEQYLVLKQSYNCRKQEAEMAIRNHKEHITEAKNKRDLQRKKKTLLPEEELILQRESQFLKAELRRIKKHFQAELSLMEQEIDSYHSRIENLKHIRKKSSFALQQKIFSHFHFRNARGESKNLLNIFKTFHSQFPPAGAGECAAPRLLQYAYGHDLHPLAMAEFWYGTSNKEENRKHGCYYPACLEKCAPILSFMMEGLDVDYQIPPPITKGKIKEKIKILYEDAWLMIVNKPAGMLSVPGKTGQLSLVEHLQKQYPALEKLYPVHRLDMDTSGVLLLAKDKQSYRNLQQQFIKRTVKKVYIASLKGKLLSQKGIINLPICPDISRRPLQIVDRQHGVTAISIYEILKQTPVETWVKLIPLTGRTHQLRVHAANRQGLNCPMVGDPLYNPTSTANPSLQRLMLHAMSISIFHPTLKKLIEVSCPFEK